MIGASGGSIPAAVCSPGTFPLGDRADRQADQPGERLRVAHGVRDEFAGPEVRETFGIANILNGILVVLLATVLIGPCPNPMMGCHATTQGALIVFGVIIALIAAADLWRLSRRG